MLDGENLRSLATLLHSQRVAALGTLDQDAPSVSMVIYALAPDGGAYLHLSQLALHTRNLQADPRASLMIAETDGSPARVPLTLGRVSLQGTVVPIPDDSPDYAAARAAYVGKFPFADFNFTLGDFGLYRFIPRSGRYIGGFARAFSLSLDDLSRAAQTTGKNQ